MINSLILTTVQPTATVLLVPVPSGGLEIRGLAAFQAKEGLSGGAVRREQEKRAALPAFAGVPDTHRQIRVYDPSQAPAVAQPKRQRGTSTALPEVLAKLNKTAAILDVLRETGRPLSTAECINIIADRHHVELDPATQDKFTSHVSASLSSLVKRGRVRHAGTMEGNKRLWEIAA